MEFRIDTDYIMRTLTELVRINSVNPSLSSDGRGEAAIAALVADRLIELGLETHSYDLGSGRANVVGTLPGTGNGRALLLNAHLDTVDVRGMSGDPFGASIRQGRLFGRGSQDMKSGLAAMLGAAKALVNAGVSLAGDLLITAVADEEFASIGAEHLVKQVRADAAIVTEPTNLTVARAHRGFIWYDVETFGRAAHGSRFQEGVDANMRMGRFLARLERLERDLRQRPGHPLAGPPTLHAAIVQGGTEISVYAANCRLQLERRTIPGETQTQATAELQAIIDELAVEDPTFQATVNPTFRRNPFENSEDSPIVKTVSRAVTNVLGQPAAHTGQTFWTDAAILADAGMDTVLLGPVGAGLHSVEEWVELQSVFDLAQILAQTAYDYCNGA